MDKSADESLTIQEMEEIICNRIGTAVTTGVTGFIIGLALGILICYL